MKWGMRAVGARNHGPMYGLFGVLPVGLRSGFLKRRNGVRGFRRGRKRRKMGRRVSIVVKTKSRLQWLATTCNCLWCGDGLGLRIDASENSLSNYVKWLGRWGQRGPAQRKWRCRRAAQPWNLSFACWRSLHGTRPAPCQKPIMPLNGHSLSTTSWTRSNTSWTCGGFGFV